MTRIYKNPKVYTFRPQKEPESLEISPKIIWVLLILLVLTGLVYFFLFSNYFKIQNIYIEGAQDLEPKVSEIINQRVAQKSNIFLFRDSAVEKELSDKFSAFSRVRITKGIPNAIKAEFEKRQAVLVCVISAKEYLIDDEGVAFTNGEIPDNLARIEKNEDIQVNDKVFTRDFVVFVKELWEKFPTKSYLKIDHIQVAETEFVIDVYSEKGWKAIFNTTKSLGKQLDNLVLILPEIGDQKIEYIDLRLEEKIYYK